MRTLLTAALAAAVTACAPVGYQRAPGPPATGGAQSAPGPVLLVVVDGLRRDVLAAHLAAVRAADDAPEWPSGLALLGDAGFKRLLADQAEAPAPAVGLAPLAALVTGRFAGEHGLAGSRVLAHGPAGRLRRYDFRSARDASHVYHGPGFALPTLGEAPVLAGLVKAATLDASIAGARHSVAVFGPFGHGAEWWVPRADGAGINAILPHRVGGAAAPLFDRGARAAAVDAVRRKIPPDVLRVYFRQVLTESTLQTARRCEAPELTVADRQAEALKAVDAHLWRLLRTWRAAHPDAFARLTVLVVSTGGVAERPTGVPVQRLEALGEILAAQAPEPCQPLLGQALSGGDLLVEGEGSAAFFAVRSAPLGQAKRVAGLTRCLSQALAAAVGGDTPWLDAAAAHGPDGAVEVMLAAGPADHLSPGRRARIEAQLAHAVGGPGSRLAAVAVLARGAVFADPEGAPLGGRGGLSAGASEAALLVAARDLTATAERALRAAPIELTDVAPTIAALTGLPTAGFPRPPFLERSPAGLIVPRADRVLGRPTASDERITVRTTDAGIQARYVEPASLWPPDEFLVRWGDGKWVWDPDSGTFAGDAPCEYTEDPHQRAWTCTFPEPPQAGVQPGGLWRLPAPGDDAPEGSADGRAFNVVVGDSTPAVEATARCADDDGLTLSLTASDPIGLDRAVVLLADAHGAGAPGDQPGTALSEVALAQPAEGGCGPATAACLAGTAPSEAPAELRIPFSANLVRHHNRASELFAAAKGDQSALRARWAADGGAGALPRNGYLAVRICNRAGRCTQRALMSLKAWDALRAKGCP